MHYPPAISEIYCRRNEYFHLVAETRTAVIILAGNIQSTVGQCVCCFLSATNLQQDQIISSLFSINLRCYLTKAYSRHILLKICVSIVQTPAKSHKNIKSLTHMAKFTKEVKAQIRPITIDIWWHFKTLQWSHMNVTSSQIPANWVVCSTT